MTTDRESEILQRLEMLASALAGRPLGVSPVEPGQPPWTDGQTIFIDPDESPRRRVEALTEQACLVAAGSLEPDIARKLTRRADLTRRWPDDRIGVEPWRRQFTHLSTDSVRSDK